MSLNEIITIFGFTGIALIVFFESGLFLFFLPGDTLLFSAGILASQGYLSLQLLLPIIILSSFLGGSAGYILGTYFSKKFETMRDNFLWNQKNITRTKYFFAKYGNHTVLFARFVPVVRTFAPLLAGMVKMPKRAFYIYSIFGSIAWTIVIISLGFFFGNIIPNVDKLMLPVMGVILMVSILVPVCKSLMKKN
ncbi:MAG: DedA family protein [bacterium]